MKAATQVFEQLLRLDREYPQVLDWLTRCHANVNRAEEAVKQVNGDAPPPALAPGVAEAEALLEAALGRTGLSSRGMPAAVDHYAILGIAYDFTPDELKRRYKKASLSAHPDRNGGSTERFAAVAAAYEVLGDAEKRRLYDMGDDIKREVQQHDGQEGPSMAERVERNYFPDRSGFEIFGDPFVSCHDHCWHLSCILPRVPAISLRTGG